MNDDVVLKWILKAENDLKTAFDEVSSYEPAYDMVCFHLQQCAEKYLKAYLIFHNQEITKTHNISFLLNQCLRIESGFEQFIGEQTDRLTYYAVEARYPDDFYMPTHEESQQALEIVESLKQFIFPKIRPVKNKEVQ
jgi:HEPN domain-containing protein